jgi:hydrogenase maturation protein HypF
MDAAQVTFLRRQLDRKVNCPLSSSLGRLYDAVSALLGVCTRTTYEAQAAIELEAAASAEAATTAYPFRREMVGDRAVIRLQELFSRLVGDVETGMPVPAIAWRFHQTIAHVIADTCAWIAAETGLRVVALSGGCFQNRILLRLAVRALRAEGFEVLMHRQVPCNDGGLSLGQAAIAHLSL